MAAGLSLSSLVVLAYFFLVALSSCRSVCGGGRTSLFLKNSESRGRWLTDRTRRDDGSSCGLSSTDLLKVEPQELNEKAEAIQAVWVGHDEILIIASDKVLRGHSTVWRGTLKSSIGIMKFEADHEAISIPVMPDSLQVSSAGERATVVVVSLNRRYIFVSTDYGKHFNQYNAPTTNFDPTDELYLSYFNPRHMVIRSNSGELWVSDSWARNWNFITSHVQLVEFALVGNRAEYVYYSVSSKSASFNPLYRMDISSRHAMIIDDSAYRFRVDSRYLFVSRKNSTGNEPADAKSRRLYVTDRYDSEVIKFTEVQLPSLQDEQFYAVMATHESGAFIHVFEQADGVSGNLYVSDSSGSRFTLSLRNHLYQVFSHPMGHFSVYDFYEVVSIRGVYITTVVDPKLNGHVTMITFDNGGMWSRLSAPEQACGSSDGRSCSLHLHLRYSQMISPFFNSSRSRGPLTVQSAPLLILAHGTVGAVRNNDGRGTKVYISNDGGYTWQDPGLPEGAYVYGIADFGNIIAIASEADHVEQIWFSHDRGSCFVPRTVDTTGVFQLSRGLLFDPSAASLLGFVMGVEGTGEEDEWRIITLDFLSLLRRPCQATDYVLTKEHTSNQNCLMGYKYSYNFTKARSRCYNPKTYDYHPVKKTVCPCNYSDYECGYGYARASATSCTRVSQASLADVCPPGGTTYQQSSSGFRQIPGDMCSSTQESEQLLALQTLPCDGNEQDSGYRVRSRSTGLTIFLAILIVIASVVAASIVLYLWLKCRSKKLARDKVYYQRLPKHEESNPFAVSDASSSDEDLITAT